MVAIWSLEARRNTSTAVSWCMDSDDRFKSSLLEDHNVNTESKKKSPEHSSKSVPRNRISYNYLPGMCGT